MGSNSMGTEIYDINGYFRGLTVGQRTLGFWDVTAWYQIIGIRLPRA